MASRELIVCTPDDYTIVHNRHVVLAWMTRKPGIVSWYSDHAAGLYRKLVHLIQAAREEQPDGSVVAKFDCPDRVYCVERQIFIASPDNPDLYETWTRKDDHWILERGSPTSVEDAMVFSSMPHWVLVRAPLEGYRVRSCALQLVGSLRSTWPGTEAEYLRLRSIVENQHVDPEWITAKLRSLVKSDYTGRGVAELISFLDNTTSACEGDEFEYYLNKCTLPGGLKTALRIFHSEYQTWTVRAERPSSLSGFTDELKTFEVEGSEGYNARTDRLIQLMQKLTDEFRKVELPIHNPENWKYWL